MHDKNFCNTLFFVKAGVPEVSTTRSTFIFDLNKWRVWLLDLNSETPSSTVLNSDILAQELMKIGKGCLLGLKVKMQLNPNVDKQVQKEIFSGRLEKEVHPS